jgi:hypothetical protein
MARWKVEAVRRRLFKRTVRGSKRVVVVGEGGARENHFLRGRGGGETKRERELGATP